MPSRWGASIARLSDGRIFVVGGASPNGGAVDLDAVPAVLDPVSLHWEYFAHPPVPRESTAVVVLDDGRVMIVGGESMGNGRDVDLLDMESGTWTSGPSLPGFSIPGGAPVGKLGDGSVLVIGTALGAPGADLGVVSVAGRFDPQSDTWHRVEAPIGLHPQCCVVSDGAFLATGGSRDWRVPGRPNEIDPEDLTNTAVFDPAAGVWRSTGHMVSTHCGAHGSVALSGERAMVIGGSDLDGDSLRLLAIDRVEIGTLGSHGSAAWREVMALNEARSSPRASTLVDDRVLVVGGKTSNGQDVRSAEIYDPVADVWNFTAPPSRSDVLHTLVLDDGRVLHFGCARDPAGEIFDPGAETWTPVVESVWGRCSR